MSGIQMMLMGAGGGVVANGKAFDHEITAAAGAPVSVSATFGSNGTFDGNGGVPNWFTPTTTGIGNSYWIRVTRTSGNAFTIGTESTWLALSSNQTFGWSSTTLARTWGGNVEFAADSGGVNIVGTNTLQMILDRI